MKKIVSLLFALLFIVSLSVTCFASDKAPLLVDNDDLLTDSEEAEILSKLEAVSKKHGMDFVIVCESAIGASTPEEFADDFYDYNGYAEDGILLLVCIDSSYLHISTTGYGITVLTDAGREYMIDQFVYDLDAGFYYDAFATYTELCDEFTTKANEGDPYDTDNLPKEPFSFIFCMVVSLIIGFVVAFIVTSVMKGQLKSVRPQNAAEAYVEKGSMKVTHSRDLFLYAHTSRRPKPKDTSSGGSRTHTSSSGRSHGGGGRSF